MSSQAFLWVNLGLGLLVVLLFVIGRKGITAPSKLNLRKGLGGSSSQEKSVVKSDVGAGKASVHFQSKPLDPFEAKMKNLNVMFMYNGHNFDAYEVLGIPAGSRLEVAQKAFEQAVRKSGSDRDFLEAALSAIKR